MLIFGYFLFLFIYSHLTEQLMITALWLDNFFIPQYDLELVDEYLSNTRWEYRQSDFVFVFAVITVT